MTGRSLQQAAADRSAAATAGPAAADGTPLTGAALIRHALDRWAPRIAELLEGTPINVAQFSAQVGNAYRHSERLWECDPGTVIGAALKCAQLGLTPNDSRNLAWIVPYKGKATFQLGYGGALELARRAVPGLKFDGREVYPNDEFDICYGRSPVLIHRPALALRKPRGGEPFAWYVRAVYPDGDEVVHAMDRERVEYHRRFSQQPDGQLWRDSYDAAALKSVVMDMRRFLPASAQFAAGLAADEQVITPDTLDDVQRVVATTTPPDSSGDAAAPDDGTRSPSTNDGSSS